MLLADRVVELQLDSGVQARSRGSGYLVTTRHVITARHVLKNLSHGTCSVQPLVDGSGLNLPLEQQLRPRPILADIAWPGDDGLDIAIVKLREPLKWGIDSARFGSVASNDLFPRAFQCAGFPRAAERKSKLVYGLSAYEPASKRFDLNIHGANVTKWDDWAGLSGAVVFCQEHAVGVVCTVDSKFQGKLTATPLRLMLENASFRAYWSKEGLQLAAHTALPRIEYSLLEILTEHLYQIDRTDPQSEIKTVLRKARGADGRSHANVIVVPGLSDDVHRYFMHKLSVNPEIQQALDRFSAPDQTIVQLSWPDEKRLVDPDAALNRLLVPIFQTAGLPDPVEGEFPDANALRRQLDEGVMPRAYWVLLRHDLAFGGHTELMDALIRFWLNLGTGRPATLFLCASLDEPPPETPNALQRMFGKPRTPEGAKLLSALKAAPNHPDGWISETDLLETIEKRHVEKWFSELKKSERMRAFSAGQLDQLNLSLQVEIGDGGRRLAHVSEGLGRLVPFLGNPYAQAIEQGHFHVRTLS